MDELKEALKLGDPDKVAALIAAGADIRYQNENGYDALIHAAYGGASGQGKARLLEMLILLIDSGVSLTGRSSHGESALRVLSRFGRFDAVHLLLQAGANPDDVQMPQLIEAVAFGTLADVEKLVRAGADLEVRDYWARTAWLIAIQTGDIAKAQFLRDSGADTEAVGRCGQPPLFYAIGNNHTLMLRWLLDLGTDPHRTNEFGRTALALAADHSSVEAIDLLLAAGAAVNRKSKTPLSRASNRDVALRLLDAGADPQALSSEGRRAIQGYPADADAALLSVSAADFEQFRARRFGAHNPEVMNNPFWEGMIVSGVNAYEAEAHILGSSQCAARRSPVWCAERFGQSLTFLPDGRIIQIAGEHEDGSDPDFCIYKDVFVHTPEGGITIYGYPESVFPPTDFHTATLVDGFIYVIGSLGYPGTRRFGETPVCRLDMNTFQIKPLETTGDKPGWIYKHRAALTAARQIGVGGGLVVTPGAGREEHLENTGVYTLHLDTLVWTKDA